MDGRSGGSRRRRARPKAQGPRLGGKVEELPAAGRAKDLFLADLELLEYYLGNLDDLKENLQGERSERLGRFVSSSDFGEEFEYCRREDFTEEGWRAVCEAEGVDPKEEVFRVRLDPYLHRCSGATPWEGLVVLIAAHALNFGSVDALIRALHHDPSSVDQARLYDKKKKDGAKSDGPITALRTAAEQLAMVVRGVELRTGARHETISRFEMEIAMKVRELDDEGYSDEEILKELREQRFLDEGGEYMGEKYDLGDVERLKKLRLRPPG